MGKLMLAVILVVCSTLSAFAQSPGDYKKVEVFVGYSHNRVDAKSDNVGPLARNFDGREGVNGVNASITGNVSRYVGLKFDYAYHRGNLDGTIDFNLVCFEGCPPVPFRESVRVHNFLGGVQLKDNTRDADKRFRPFGHVLVGAHHTSAEIPFFACPVCLPPGPGPFFRAKATGFAAVVGGGLDVRLSDRVSVRAAQLDWNPNRFGSDSGFGIGSHTTHNFRAGVGVVFH